MPQISQILDTYGSQLFWLLISFGLIYFIIGRGMMPKIQGTVQMREKRIADDVEAARLAHKQADELEEQYAIRDAEAREEAHGIILAARDKASKNTERRLKDADKRVSETLTDAEKELSAQREAALDEVEESATEAVQAIFAKITGAKVTKPQARSAVKGAIKDA